MNVTIQVIRRPKLTSQGEVWEYHDYLLATTKDGRLYSAKVPAIGEQPVWEVLNIPRALP
jgi:hypothetical protein